MQAQEYDIIIIGAGSAGLGALGMAQQMGWTPLLIDKEETNIGGDCLNFGCVPSKALIHIAKQFHGARKATDFGISISGKADIKKILAYVHDKQEIIRAHESAAYIREQGIDLVIGTASFANEKTVQVNNQYYTAQRIIIATGSRPRWIHFKGIEEVNVFTNETLFYDIKQLPDNLLVIGGGPIGCEMAQTFQRLGSSVVIVNRGARILSKEIPSYSEILHTQLQNEGLTILNNANVLEFTSSRSALIELVDGSQQIVEFDAVLLAVGRQLNIEDLQLEKANIEITERGKIKIDDYLSTSNSRVYVSGDAAGMYQFSHGAEMHTRLLSQNFEKDSTREHDAKHLSWVTFTQPEIATFGRSEEYLKSNNIPYWRQDQSFNHDDRAIVDEYTYGQITLYLTPKTFWNRKRKILGGSIICPNAGEIMQELTLAMENDIPIEAIYKKVYAYPVASRINQQTIMGVIKNDLT